MTLPRKVVPAKTAEFTAMRWEGSPEDNDSLQWMADQYGWRVVWASEKSLTSVPVLGRNRRRYTVKRGDWVIALGTNGSVRVCSDKQYRQDYREASE